MKTLVSALALLLATYSLSNAQTPSPAKMGITHATNPEVVSVLDASNTWAQMGSIDKTTHAFTPVGGAGGGGPGCTGGTVCDVNILNWSGQPVAAPTAAGTAPTTGLLPNINAYILNHLIIDTIPLASGAATAALQTTGNNLLNTIATNTGNGATATLQSSGNASLNTIASNTTGAATAALQNTGNTSLNTIASNTTGAATAALQNTGNTSLSTIATNSGNAATSALQTTGNTSAASTATNTSTIATNQTSGNEKVQVVDASKTNLFSAANPGIINCNSGCTGGGGGGGAITAPLGPSTAPAAAVAVTETGSAITGQSLPAGGQGVLGWLSTIVQSMAQGVFSPGGAAPGQGIATGGFDVNGLPQINAIDPCTLPKSYFDLVSTSSTAGQLVAGIAGKKIYVCAGTTIFVSAAMHASLVEGSGSTCTTPLGVYGNITTGAVAASGFSFIANQGIELTGLSPAATKTTGNSLCFLADSASQANIHVAYVVQ